METAISDYRQIGALNLLRYRVTGGARCVVVEGAAMVTGPCFMVAGLLIVSGLVVVKKSY